jgi:hypothetical protein
MDSGILQALLMTVQKPVTPANPSGVKKPGDRAFDTWLKQGLHKIFDDVAREPIPPELLKLIEEHREK